MPLERKLPLHALSHSVKQLLPFLAGAIRVLVEL
jgi:hypothetical protein